MNRPNKNKTLHRCPRHLVTVIRKHHQIKRYPKHNYPVVVFVLRPKPGTRVQQMPDGGVEFMPNFDELRALLIGISPALGQNLPPNYRNKPIERKAYYDSKNAKRHSSQ